MYDIIIKKNDDNQEILVLENGILTERITQPPNLKNIEGNIYLGKVKNVLPGLQAAFIDIGESKNTFIHLKDILPKVDETTSQKKYSDVSIKDVIKSGEPILVQVKRAESNQKGARVSTHISITGKYVVLMPNTDFITISQKIENISEQERLKSIIKSLIPENMGAIIRTSAIKKSEAELKKDVDYLLQEWEKMLSKSKKAKTFPCIIYTSYGILERLLTDLIEKDIKSITVNDSDTFNEVSQVAKKIKDVNVILDPNINNNQDLLKQISEAEKRKIWLKCGGFITIDKTEALTAIDVNSGKFIGSQNLEKTIFTVNKEATVEIAKQIRLRDIGGIIIIDYIDMNDQKNRENIEKLLNDELKKDRSKTQVVGFTKLNLLEMTRKHIN